MSTTLVILYFAVILGMVYVFFVLPQKRRSRMNAKMSAALKSGDKVVTIGGIFGVIRAVDDSEAMLEVAPDVEVKVAKRAIARVLTDADGPSAENGSASLEERRRVVGAVAPDESKSDG